MSFHPLRKYYKRKELAGMRPICAHVAVACALTERNSSGFSSSSTSIERHAILDYVNEVYFHFGTSGLMKTSKVVFEATYGLVNRIVAVPSGEEEGYAILRRAHACFEEQADIAWAYNVATCNCEHFVQYCWTPDAGQYSSQVPWFAAVGDLLIYSLIKHVYKKHGSDHEKSGYNRTNAGPNAGRNQFRRMMMV